jgi:hypothetical protein
VLYIPFSTVPFHVGVSNSASFLIVCVSRSRQPPYLGQDLPLPHTERLRHQARGQLDIYCQAPQNAKVSQVCLASCVVIVCANRIVFPAESRSYVVLLCSQGSLSVVLRSTPVCGYSEGCVPPALRLISCAGHCARDNPRSGINQLSASRLLTGSGTLTLQFMSCS